MVDSNKVAPNISDFYGNGERFRDLSKKTISLSNATNIGESGNYNYVLKCTDGIFSGKFLFINTTPDGELFGSGDPEKIDLTMYIESAELSEQHAEIKFVENCKYLLRDCGSETGTWVRVNEMDIYSANRR